MFNFDTIIVCAVIATGILTLIKFFKILSPLPKWLESFQSFFPVLFLVMIIRTFLIQMHYVPTGSLEPTVLPGDLVATNQFAYGLHLPITHTKVMNISNPVIGDIVVFISPINPKETLVKRVIGTPGDRIRYENKQLTVNGKLATQTLKGKGMDLEPFGNVLVDEKTEDLAGKPHNILVKPTAGTSENFELVVPPHHYFMMGDNRDNSFDSRHWGFVPEANIVGKAFAVVLSWDKDHYTIRWKRTVKML